jgi:hypothetical protein
MTDYNISMNIFAEHKAPIVNSWVQPSYEPTVLSRIGKEGGTDSYITKILRDNITNLESDFKKLEHEVRMKDYKIQELTRSLRYATEDNEDLVNLITSKEKSPETGKDDSVSSDDVSDDEAETLAFFEKKDNYFITGKIRNRCIVHSNEDKEKAGIRSFLEDECSFSKLLAEQQAEREDAEQEALVFEHSKWD